MSESPHVIVGGAGGIGLHTAVRLLERCEAVVVIDREELPGDLADRPRLSGFCQDITDEAGMDELTATLLERWPRITSVIATAGTNAIGSFPGTDFTEWNRLIATNVTGVLRAVHALLPSLIASAEAGERADVITIGSIADQSYFDHATIYGTASAALKSFAAQLRIEVRDEGVRVSNIAPGYIKSTFAESLPELSHEYDWLGEGLLMPEDVVDVIEFTLDQPVGVHLGDLDIVATKQGWA